MNQSLKVLGIILFLYFAPSLILKATYGESYILWASDNYWVADGDGGWNAFGQPIDPIPTEKSVIVNMWLWYLPIFLPTIFLILLMFTPMFKHLDTAKYREKKDEDNNDNNGQSES